MPAFTLDASIYSLDINDFKEVVEIFMGSEASRAVKMFLRACLARIPIRTGFLRGSFRELQKAFDPSSGPRLNPFLAELLSNEKLFKEREAYADKKFSKAGLEARNKNLARAIKEAEKRQKKNSLKKFKSSKSSPKSGGVRLAHGEYYYGQKGRPILKTPTSGIQFTTPAKDVIKNNGNVVTFQINTAISYYRINDFYSRIKGAPWGSLDAGASAMVSSLERSVRRFPQLNEILTKFHITLRGTDVTTKKEFQKFGPNVVKQRLLSITGGDL